MKPYKGVRLQARARLLARIFATGPVTLVSSGASVKFPNAETLEKVLDKSDDIMRRFRIGHYLIVNHSKDISVARMWPTLEQDEPGKTFDKDGRNWGSICSSKSVLAKDTLRKLEQFHHPLLKEVSKDIHAELEFFKPFSYF